MTAVVEERRDASLSSSRLSLIGSNSTEAVGPKGTATRHIPSGGTAKLKDGNSSFSSAEAMLTNNVAAMMPQTIPRCLASMRFDLHQPDRKGDCVTLPPKTILCEMADHCCAPPPLKLGPSPRQQRLSPGSLGRARHQRSNVPSRNWGWPRSAVPRRYRPTLSTFSAMRRTTRSAFSWWEWRSAIAPRQPWSKV